MPASGSNGNTPERAKRSSIPDEILDTDSAAKMLGVSPRTIRNYAAKGLLKTVRDSAGKICISLHDIAALSSTLVEGFDLARVARTAVKALISSSRAERRLERLEHLLGVDSFSLDTTEEGVVAFHRQCVDLLAEYVEDLNAAEVLEWAYQLAAVTEEYLEAVGLHTGEEEPWAPFMNAAQKLYDCAPRGAFNYRKDLELAYGYLAAARRHLRQVAYFYIRKQYGVRVAEKAVPESTLSERDAKILRMVTMLRQK
jgi:DNA-binding transcriptional MerR regulator